MGQFLLDIQKFMRKADANQTLVLRKIITEMYTRIVMRSPVDTGRFRANWFPSIGAMNPTVNWGAVDPTGINAMQRIAVVVGQFNVGDNIHLTNNLPYARRLEYGYSAQAPMGMVRITTAEFQSVIDQVVAELPK